jgi:uncharacterized protein DUF6557
MGRLKKEHNNYKTIGKWKKYQEPSVSELEVIKHKSVKKPIKVKYKSLVRKFKDHEAVADRLVELYPDMKKSREGYLDVMKELQTLKPTRTKFKISVEEVEDWYDKSKYVDVSGIDPNDDISYAIEYTRWEEWLNMEITKESLKNFSELDVYCHCLWEMTWSGFSQEPIQEKIQSLMETVEKIRAEGC